MQRALIVGFGSIGRRHAQNLRNLRAGEISVYDTDPVRRAAAEREVDARAFDTLEAALDAEPTVVFVCTPPGSHLQIALAGAERGCHLFIEKPLADRLGPPFDRLRSLVAAKRLVTLVGCNLRFHHGPSTLKRLLEEGVIGRVVGASLEMGQYLPDWHPGEDYRYGYSASRAMGGGIVLDAIHELDYSRWLFGEVREVFGFGGKVSGLEIETEDFASILLRFASGCIAQVHLDYLQRAYSRWCRVVGEEGTLVWDITPGSVRLYTPSAGRWQEFPQPPDYQVNDMYMAELQHLLRCQAGEEASVQPVDAAAAVVRIALAARESMATGRKVTVS
jgi:predicted dehydrogenase